MRKIRIAVVAVFLLSAIAYGWFTLFADRGKDTTPPTIQCSQDTLQLSVQDDDSRLLEGLTAQDDVDGDITANIRVSSLSRFASQGKRTVDYVVFDSANNFATFSRTVQYTDYQSPRIWLDAPLRVDMNQLEKFDPSTSLRAEDVLDGDISSKVRVSINNGAYVADVGNYPITVQVSNSAGDTVTVPLEMSVIDSTDPDESGKYYPMLSQYIAYTKVGQGIDPMQFLCGVMRGNQSYLFPESAVIDDEDEDDDKDRPSSGSVMGIERSDIDVNNMVDAATPGTYTVEYSYTSDDDITAVTKLVVVVEE